MKPLLFTKLMTEHPINPTPELVQQWVDDFAPLGMLPLVIQAARWGADQELEACCEWLGSIWPVVNVPIDELRADRRPKPPSFKEQALKALDDISIASFEQDAANTIRYALEQLDD